MNNDAISQEELAKIAKSEKDNFNIAESEDSDVEVEVEDAPAVEMKKIKKAAIRGVSAVTENTSTDVTPVDDLISNTSAFKITDDDLKANMPDLSPELFGAVSGKLRNEIEAYRKGLILQGYTMEEADTAARNRLLRKTKEENDNYLATNPKVGIIEIDKKNEEKLELTQEEHDKLSKVKSIRLVVVEDQELKTMEIEKIDKKHKSSIIQMIDGNLAKFSLPVPIAGDFMNFKGAQIIQLISAVKYDDDGLDALIAKKAGLLYDRLAGGTHFVKYDEYGKTIMSYNDFINKYPFHDMDLGLYAIFVASSQDQIETGVTCGHCNSNFNWRYDAKGLLNLDDLNDHFKELLDDVLGNKTNSDFLTSIYEKNKKTIRVKSPFTNNQYDISYPSIAKAINIYNSIVNKDDVMIYLSATAMFLNSIYLYNIKTGKYVEIEDTDYKELMETMEIIPQEDLDMLMQFIQERIYEPKFILKSKCPHCGNEMRNNLNVDDLVFLKARDTSKEIHL